MKSWWKASLTLALAFGSGGLAMAQDTPQFHFLGDASQTLLSASPSWSSSSTPIWGLALDFKPTWSDGGAAFLADGTVDLPLTSTLSVSSPLVSFYEVYLRLTPIAGLDLTFGKKRFNIGVGQTFTVGDSINPALGFFDQKTGFRGIEASWSPNSWFGWTTGVSLERNLGADRWNPATELVPTTGSSNPTDLTWATQVAVLLDKFQGTASVVWSADRTFNPAVGASYDWEGFLLTAEGAMEFLPQVIQPTNGPVATWTTPLDWLAPAPSGSAGIRRTWSFQNFDLTAAVEYLYWGQGWSTAQVNSWKLATSGTSTSGSAALYALEQGLEVRDQHNVFFQLDLAQADTFDLAALWVLDLQDASSLVQASVTVFPWDSLDLSGSFEAATGGSSDAWSGVPLPLRVAPLGAPAVRYLVNVQTIYHF